QRLLEIGQAQAEALVADDFATLALLFDERAALQETLDQDLTSDERATVRATLSDIAELDRQNVALASRLLPETGQALPQLHSGRSALQSYGRPGAHLRQAAAILDQSS